MPDEPRPFKLPLWPLPPLVVIGFTGIALATQETQYLVAEVILIVLALAAWAGSKKWSPRPTPSDCGRRDAMSSETRLRASIRT